MPRVLFGVTVAMTAQAFLRDQMTELAARGWDVHLACSAEDGTKSWGQLSDLQGVTRHNIPMDRPPHPLHDIVAFVRWSNLIKRLGPDVVVASTPKAGLLAMWAARLRHTPTRIYHIRGLRAEGLSGTLKAISLLSERAAIAAATAILVDGPSLLGGMRRDGLLAPDQGVVLGSGSCCGVDTDWFRPPNHQERIEARAKSGVTDDDVVVGYVGRLAVDKGIRELVAAVQSLHEGNSRVRLVLVGPIEEPEALIEALSIVKTSDWAVTAGPTGDPRSAYWAFDVACLPSYREGFPISPLEAQACGLPVITTDATGCRDAVQAGTTGMVVPARDAEELQSAIEMLSMDPALRATMGSAGREWVAKEFDQRVVRGRVLRFINAERLRSQVEGES